ncbi:bile acid:sodium symporter [Sphingomonas sp. HITSZ_GF]|uniref:bile acid:sodium symporter family protein n=1 Tax=Sphingomonas sp. HITSZ_GF TaxID=3037247 RepID=UPI00240E0A0E|nr:bile acid:sodium symporter family protein [Sphingomonas sp. HITSZ_GF]MDG2535015.1 bile acid:sodium symporter [Sphingomonas sp. HITSZ_GF]
MIRRILSIFEPFILTLVGTVLLASLLPPRGALVPVFDMAADAGIVLLFFLHGAKLSRDAIVAGMRNWRLHLAVFASTYLLFPLLGLGFAQLPLLAPGIAMGVLFLALLPSTVQSSIAFTAMARGNVAAAVCSASFSNLIGIVLTPALVALLMQGSHGMGGVSLSAVEKIVMQLLVPFVAGHLLRPWIGSWVGRHKKLVTLVDRGSILLVVYTAFGAAVVEGLWSKVSGLDLAILFLVCAVMLAIVLAATWFAARALRLPREDAVVLLFCGSKKSLASGVPMAGVLFPAAQVGVVLLPIMLFHQLQLIVCAVLARRLGYLPEDAADQGSNSEASP